MKIVMLIVGLLAGGGFVRIFGDSICGGRCGGSY